jgi:hypothetical protein
MMSDKMALKIAIDLLHVPSQVRLLRREPLPDGVLLLLRIASGDGDAERTAVAMSGRSLETVRRSAAFFIEQIMFAANADSYRVLGAGPQASAGELRRNVGLLLRWLHPDIDRGGARSIFVRKVTEAWNNLKTSERRAAYDAQRRSAKERTSRGKGSSVRHGKNGRLAALGRRRLRQVDEHLIYWPEKMGFFRRALSFFLQRPLG